MSYCNKCPNCGANLDPGERCDCDRAPTFLTIREVSQRWSVSVDLIYDMIRSGTLKALKIGGTTWRIPLSSVEEYEQTNTTGYNSSGGKKRPSGKPRKPVLRI